jgi:hypothetical protein
MFPHPIYMKLDIFIVTLKFRILVFHTGKNSKFSWTGIGPSTDDSEGVLDRYRLIENWMDRFVYRYRFHLDRPHLYHKVCCLEITMTKECRLKTLQPGRRLRQQPKKQIFSATTICPIFTGGKQNSVYLFIHLSSTTYIL